MHEELLKKHIFSILFTHSLQADFHDDAAGAAKPRGAQAKRIRPLRPPARFPRLHHSVLPHRLREPARRLHYSLIRIWNTKLVTHIWQIWSHSFLLFINSCYRLKILNSKQKLFRNELSHIILLKHVLHRLTHRQVWKAQNSDICGESKMLQNNRKCYRSFKDHKARFKRRTLLCRI